MQNIVRYGKIMRNLETERLMNDMFTVTLVQYFDKHIFYNLHELKIKVNLRNYTLFQEFQILVSAAKSFNIGTR